MPNKKPSLLLYLHGFNSSPQSTKAQLMMQYCQQHRPDIKVVAPQLPHFPAQAEVFLTEFMDAHLPDYTIGLIGSSLGGFLSTWLNDKYSSNGPSSNSSSLNNTSLNKPSSTNPSLNKQRLKAVLVNPAVKPHELLVNFLGEQENMYTKERYVLEEKHIDELKALYVEQVKNVDDFWALLQTDDEVLDYRQAVARYGEAQCLIEQGGDHSFVGFERMPEKIIEFLGL